MALLGVSPRERMLDYGGIEMLPDLVEDVFFVDALVLDLEESFVSGIEDWWGEFISDMCL